MATQTPYSKIDHQPLLDQNDDLATSTSIKILYVFLSFAAIISATLVAFNFFRNSNDISSSSFVVPLHVCDSGFHSKASCLAMLNESINGDELIGKSSVPSNSDFLQIFLNKSVPRISNTMEVVNGFNRFSNDLKEQALRNCIELMDSSIDRVNDSVESLRENTQSNHESLDDAHTWLSAVLTNHVTCLDGLNEVSELGLSVRLPVEMEMKDLIARARVSLAMIAEISASSSSYEDTTSWLASKTLQLPSWVTMRDRKLLETPSNAVTANVVVAKDGSGRFKSVQEAVTAAPNNTKTRYVIHVKKGVYKEKVEIGKKKINLMIVGDGMDATVITGSLNFIDGTSTYNSATVVVQGDGFIAQDICFQNTAGPEKHQAVAIRVGADQTVFSRCKFDAYQDTLYAHSLRQFYRDCSIMGTVDFIFGNAAMVVQNSKVIARKPMKNQNNMCTAQGRTDPNQNTGTSIQNCNVIASSDLEPVKGSFKTFLGRPWKAYSRTVYMESFLGDLINPAGWAEWNASNPFTKTLFYGEYANRGPGAGTANRVKWPGYHVIKNPAEAEKFTVAELIQGGVWLKSTGVAFTEGL
ncbi:pectinesterase-like [Papaver somniferum]|nr:pectinesterase-like [Papaver somniferum]